MDILDSVCVLYFAASGQTQLLVDILSTANYTILLPAEVLIECEDKAKAQGWNIAGLYRFLGERTSGRPIVKLPPITAATPNAMTALTGIRKGHPKGVTGSANLGECVCVTHALGAKGQGRAVVVSMDDIDGQNLADAKKVPFITIEEMLKAGVDHKVITKPEARAAYNKMVPFGSSLPTWPASELESLLRM